MKTKNIYLIKTLTKEETQNVYDYTGWIKALSSLKKAQSEIINSSEVNKGFDLVKTDELLPNGKKEFIRLDYSVNRKDIDGNLIGGKLDIRHIIEKN